MGDYRHVKVPAQLYEQILDYCRNVLKIRNITFTQCLEYLYNRLREQEVGERKRERR